MSYYESVLFRVSPRPIQAGILSLRNFTRRQIYRTAGLGRVRRQLAAMESWSRADLERYQGQRLGELVRSAAREVPYYRDLFARLSLNADDIRSLSDLARLPLLEKRPIREAPERFLAGSRRSPLLAGALTSGSTGAPLRLYRDLESICWEEARLWRWRGRAGICYGDRRALLRGDSFIPATDRTEEPWLHDRLGHLLLVSSYHLRPALLPRILDEVRAFRPRAVEGYPGALADLARHLNQVGSTLPVRAVLTSSEQLYPQQRALLRQAFAAEVFDQYGMAERAALASECVRHRLHVDMECSILEVLRKDGSPCHPGEAGEIVGTSLTNAAMPLIRYRTGDVGRLALEPCECGIDRPYLEELQGRDDDFVTGTDGTRFSPTILTFPFETAQGVDESQILHPAPGRLLIRLAPAPGYADRELRAATAFIRSDLEGRLGGGWQIDFEIVPEVAKAPNGKFRWIVAGDRAKGA
jgi:phenylacetate-CoA ligase